MGGCLEWVGGGRGVRGELGGGEVIQEECIFLLIYWRREITITIQISEHIVQCIRTVCISIVS